MALSKKTKRKLEKYLDLAEEYEALKERMMEISAEQEKIESYIQKHVKKEFRETDEILVKLKGRTARILKYEKKITKWKQVYDKLYDKVNKDLQKTMDRIRRANSYTQEYVKITKSTTASVRDFIKKMWIGLKTKLSAVIQSLRNFVSSAKDLLNVLPKTKDLV